MHVLLILYYYLSSNVLLRICYNCMLRLLTTLTFLWSFTIYLHYLLFMAGECAKNSGSPSISFLIYNVLKILSQPEAFYKLSVHKTVIILTSTPTCCARHIKVNWSNTVTLDVHNQVLQSLTIQTIVGCDHRIVCHNDAPNWHLTGINRECLELL